MRRCLGSSAVAGGGWFGSAFTSGGSSDLTSSVQPSCPPCPPTRIRLEECVQCPDSTTSFASASAGFCIYLYSLSVCSCSSTTSFLVCCISTEQTTEKRKYSVWEYASFLEMSFWTRALWDCLLRRSLASTVQWGALANAVDKLLVTLFYVPAKRLCKKRFAGQRQHRRLCSSALLWRGDVVLGVSINLELYGRHQWMIFDAVSIINAGLCQRHGKEVQFWLETVRKQRPCSRKYVVVTTTTRKKKNATTTFTICHSGTSLPLYLSCSSRVIFRGFVTIRSEPRFLNEFGK